MEVNGFNSRPDNFTGLKKDNQVIQLFQKTKRFWMDTEPTWLAEKKVK